MVQTHLPQGFYKDQVYFIGAIQILQHRHSIDFVQLHSVKLSLADFQTLAQNKLIQTQHSVVPSFIRDISQSKKALDITAQTNSLL